MIINQIAAGGGGGIDTSDATAYPEHILKDYTAYARGSKIVGTMPATGFIRYKRHIATPDLSLPVAASISITIPANIVDGDLIVTSVVHRDTVTPPTGFIFVATAANSDLNQQESIYYKVCDGDAGAVKTFTQATAQRIGVDMIIADCSGEVSVDTYNTTTSTTTPVPFPAVTSSVKGAFCVFLTGSVYTSNVITLSGVDWITFNTTGNGQRIAVAARHVNAGSVPALTITHTNSSSIGCVAVIFKAT
jgi:hypothetical protein